MLGCQWTAALMLYIIFSKSFFAMWLLRLLGGLPAYMRSLKATFERQSPSCSVGSPSEKICMVLP